MIEKQQEIIDLISNNFQNNNIGNSDLVQIIELCGNYLNLQTISDYSKNNNISYNGVKKCRKIIKLFNVKLVIDNN